MFKLLEIGCVLIPLLIGISCAEPDEDGNSCEFQVTHFREGGEIAEVFCAENINNEFQSSNLTIKRIDGGNVTVSGKFKIERFR